MLEIRGRDAIAVTHGGDGRCMCDCVNELQRAENRGQRAESRGQRAEGRGQVGVPMV
jgi:hypothetical protein